MYSTSDSRRPLRVLTFTTLFPNSEQPSHGVFVENRLRHLVASGEVESVVVIGRLDAAALLDTVDREAVKNMVIVGDAFAKPILRALEENPGRWRLSTLRVAEKVKAPWSPNWGVFRAHQKQIVAFRPHRAYNRTGRRPQRKGRPSSRWLKGLGIQDQLV